MTSTPEDKLTVNLYGNNAAQEEIISILRAAGFVESGAMMRTYTTKAGHIGIHRQVVYTSSSHPCLKHKSSPILSAHSVFSLQQGS